MNSVIDTSSTQTSSRKKSWVKKHFTIVALSFAIVVTSAVLLHIMFQAEVSELTIEILAAVVAVVMVVASVAVTLHFQADYETDREFKTELFRARLNHYKELLIKFSAADDDDHISDEEVIQMKNSARSIALLASADVVVTLSNYIRLIDDHRSLYITREQAENGEVPLTNPDYAGTFRNLVIQMRQDLRVVEGDGNEVYEAVQRLVSPEGWKS